MRVEIIGASIYIEEVLRIGEYGENLAQLQYESKLQADKTKSDTMILRNEEFNMQWQADTGHLSNLELLSDHDDLIPGIYARNILIATGNYQFKEVYKTPSILKFSLTIEYPQKINKEKDQLILYPNPAYNFVIVDYNCKQVDMDEPFTTKEGSKLIIYPNPAKDKIKIQLPEYIVTSQQTQNFEVTKVHYQYKGRMELKVYDSFGREVKKKALNNKDDVEMDVRILKEGIYLVVFCLDDDVVCTGKFVKQ